VHKFFIIFSFLQIASNQSWGKSQEIKDQVAASINTQALSFKDLPLSDSSKQQLTQHKIQAKSHVLENEHEQTQELDFKIAGLHKKQCTRALEILSRYENYSTYLDFVKTSNYNSSTQLITFLLDSPILPFSMVLSFNLPRISREGRYLFYFSQGFLQGLRGTISVAQHNKQCLFYTEAHWKGRHSKIPSTVFEIFSQTLARIAMEKLFRISGGL